MVRSGVEGRGQVLHGASVSFQCRFLANHAVGTSLIFFISLPVISVFDVALVCATPGATTACLFSSPLVAVCTGAIAMLLYDICGMENSRTSLVQRNVLCDIDVCVPFPPSLQQRRPPWLFYAALSSTRSRSFSTTSRGPRSRTASSRSNSLGGDGDEERRPLFASTGTNGASKCLSHGSLSSTTAANTSSNMITSFGGGSGDGPTNGDEGGGRTNNLGGSGGGSSGSIAGGGSGSGNGSHFSKPTKAVSFAGDDDHHADGGGIVLDRNGHGDYSSIGIAALEDRSPDRSPVRSPLRGSRLAALPQGLGYLGVGLGAANGDVNVGLVPGSDEFGSEFGDTAGSTTSSTQGVLGGDVEDGDEEGEMANFIVLDCSKVTNVSGCRRSDRRRCIFLLVCALSCFSHVQPEAMPRIGFCRFACACVPRGGFSDALHVG